MTPYLQKRGIEVTESDLGERIQQLSDEPPSHIVVPAIHKLRSDVAALFAEELGTDPKNSDPHDLAEAMRQNARPRFLKADAGMTGANFAVAETGGFVVCTNEGNADIGASVPPLHIASIGIEKLIPRARDLGVFIRMLSRSALGSPITQYTSHFHGPRQGGELHVVLVDNTRSDRLGSPDFWHALKCIRCGACMNTCPVYRRGGGLSYGATYSGPIGVILDPGFDLSQVSRASLPLVALRVVHRGVPGQDRHLRPDLQVAARGGREGDAEAQQEGGHECAGDDPGPPGGLPRCRVRRGVGPGAPAAVPALQPAQPVGQAPRAAGRPAGRRSASGISRTGGKHMSPRDAILAAVRRNLPRPAVPLPEIPGSERKGVKHGLGYKEHLTRMPEVAGAPNVNEPILPHFLRQLEAMGGRSFEVADAAAARAKVAELFPDAKVVCSAVPEVPGTRRIEDVRDPHELNDVDVGVVRSPLGVAEAGAVWLTQANLVVNALGVLSQHLVVLARSRGSRRDHARRLRADRPRRQPLRGLPGGAVGHRGHRGGDHPRCPGRPEPDRPAPGADALGGDETRDR